MLQSICLHLHINRANLTTFLFIRKMQIFITVHPYSTLVFLFCFFISLSCFSLAFLSLAHSPCSCLLIDKVFLPCMCLCVCERGRERASVNVCIDISGKLHRTLTTHWIFRDSLMLIGDCNTCSSYINAGDCEPRHIMSYRQTKDETMQSCFL